MDRVALRISHAYSESYSIMEFWNGGLAWIFRLVFQTVFWMNGSVDTICWWFPHAQCRLNYIVGFISEKNKKNDTPILVPKKLSLGFQSTIFSQLWLICPKIMKATWLRMLSFFGKAHLSTVCVSCDLTGDNKCHAWMRQRANLRVMDLKESDYKRNVHFFFEVSANSSTDGSINCTNCSENDEQNFTG